MRCNEKLLKKLNIKISAARGRLLSEHCFVSAFSRQQQRQQSIGRKNYVKQNQKKRSFSSRVYVCMYIVFVCVLCNETETGKQLLLMKTSEMCK